MITTRPVNVRAGDVCSDLDSDRKADLGGGLIGRVLVPGTEHDAQNNVVATTRTIRVICGFN